MNKSFNYEVSKVLKNAELEMLELNHPYVGTEHLLLSLLKKDSISKKCEKYGLTYDKFRKELINIVGNASKKSEVVLYTPLLRVVIDNAITLAKDDNKELSENYLMMSLISSDDGIALRILDTMDVDLDKIYQEFSSGNLEVLKDIGVDLSTKMNGHLVGREKEIDNVIEILLRKNKNNPLLIGECGVGKSAIVYELARRIKLGCVPERLKNMRIISVDMASMLSNTKYRGEFETRLNNIIKEVMSSKNIILFIDEIHTIVKSGGGDGSIDAANILKPYLAYDDIKIIGATTTSEYEKFISKDKALARRFESVLVKEPSKEETVNILLGVKEMYENFHHVNITDENILDIVDCANKYIFTNHNPDKSLDVLDYVCSRVVLNNERKNNPHALEEALSNHDYKKALVNLKKMQNIKSFNITHEDIISVIESMTNIKMFDYGAYKQLVSILDKKIIGQDLTNLKEILKKKLVPNKLLSFMIRGEEHVGKTYTASLIAKTLNYNFIELDMGEYTTSTSLTKLIGSDPGYVGYEDVSIFDTLKYQPYSLILLKNYDYAHPKVKNLFKSIIDNGSIKDNKGNVINFNNTIIIMTSTDVKHYIGYSKKDNIDDNSINYNLIDKKFLKHYFKENNISDEAYKSLDDKVSFKEVLKLINDDIYNSLTSVV